MGLKAFLALQVLSQSLDVSQISHKTERVSQSEIQLLTNKPALILFMNPPHPKLSSSCRL